MHAPSYIINDMELLVLLLAELWGAYLKKSVHFKRSTYTAEKSYFSPQYLQGSLVLISVSVISLYNSFIYLHRWQKTYLFP